MKFCCNAKSFFVIFVQIIFHKNISLPRCLRGEAIMASYTTTLWMPLTSHAFNLWNRPGYGVEYCRLCEVCDIPPSCLWSHCSEPSISKEHNIRRVFCLQQLDFWSGFSVQNIDDFEYDHSSCEWTYIPELMPWYIRLLLDICSVVDAVFKKLKRQQRDFFCAGVASFRLKQTTCALRECWCTLELLRLCGSIGAPWQAHSSCLLD